VKLRSARHQRRLILGYSDNGTTRPRLLPQTL